MWNVLVRAAHTKPLGTLIPGEVRGWCQGIPEASEHGEGRGVRGFHALRGLMHPMAAERFQSGMAEPVALGLDVLGTPWLRVMCNSSTVWGFNLQGKHFHC